MLDRRHPPQSAPGHSLSLVCMAALGRPEYTKVQWHSVTVSNDMSIQSHESQAVDCPKVRQEATEEQVVSLMAKCNRKAPLACDLATAKPVACCQHLRVCLCDHPGDTPLRQVEERGGVEMLDRSVAGKGLAAGTKHPELPLHFALASGEVSHQVQCQQQPQRHSNTGAQWHSDRETQATRTKSSFSEEELLVARSVYKTVVKLNSNAVRHSPSDSLLRPVLDIESDDVLLSLKHMGPVCPALGKRLKLGICLRQAQG